VSTAESFCYVALLKNPQALAAQLALLSAERRTEIESLRNDLRVLSEAELRTRWQRLRHAEAQAKMRDCLERYGTRFKAFSPRLQIWLSQAF
jgi:hypothetical protein